MVQMYKLCSEQLSQQDHYDFGMRAVKSVLVMAGALKRASPDRNEDVVLICALRDSNLPKFLVDDAILFKVCSLNCKYWDAEVDFSWHFTVLCYGFQGILNDLFPGVDLPVANYGKFEETIRDMLVQNNFQPEECIIRKVIQLYETMNVRWGVMLVGPTGGGKSAVLKVCNAKSKKNLYIL